MATGPLAVRGVTDTSGLIRQWDTSGNAAKQVAANIAREIHNGRLGKWQDLPPEDEIADDNGVSRRTVGNAKKVLAEHGLLKKVAGRYYVA